MKGSCSCRPEGLHDGTPMNVQRPRLEMLRAEVGAPQCLHLPRCSPHSCRG